MKAGTRIALALAHGRCATGTIVRTTREMLPLPEGFHPVLFDDGNVPLLVHESGIRLKEVA